MPASRCFLFLQGPPGPFFRLLGAALTARGCRVLRINLNGGDAHDWPGTHGWPPAQSWRGPAPCWPAFLAATLRDHGVTDLILFGDCRPRHAQARALARDRGIAVHVVEEGYLRPSWLTLERGGVNGHSSLSRDPQTYLAQAAVLPSPAPDPGVEATMMRRIQDTTAYFANMVIRSPLYPFHRSHRPDPILREALGWIAKHRARARTTRQTDTALARIAAWRAGGGRTMLFPLQLSSDYQIRAHSPFATMEEAATHVLADFAAHAPADMALIVKDHPLDSRLHWTGRTGWTHWLTHRAAALGLGDRLIAIPGGDLRALCATCQGLVTVNSTSATFALSAGVPVIALGHAVYAMPGLTHQGALATFWNAPSPPDPELWDAFTRVLHRDCLIRGGLASSSAVAMAVESAVEKLLKDEG